MALDKLFFRFRLVDKNWWVLCVIKAIIGLVNNQSDSWTFFIVLIVNIKWCYDWIVAGKKQDRIRY